MIGASLVATAIEVSRVFRALPAVERGLAAEGPLPLLVRLRREGQRATPRDAASRARLQRAIRWVDACAPGKRSCYRRALLEIALDPDAAREPLRMGLDVRGHLADGHAWIGDDPAARRYDIELDV